MSSLGAMSGLSAFVLVTDNQFVQNLLILFGLGLVIPFGVALLTKTKSPDWVKNMVTPLLAALSAVGLQITQGLLDGTGASLDGYRLVVQAVGLWMASAFAYMKLWKGNPIMEFLKDFTADVGVGKPEPQPDPDPPPNVAVLPPAMPVPGATSEAVAAAGRSLFPVPNEPAAPAAPVAPSLSGGWSPEVLKELADLVGSPVPPPGRKVG